MAIVKRRRSSKSKPKIPKKPAFLRSRKTSTSNNGNYTKRTGNYLKGHPKRTGTHAWGVSHTYGTKNIPKWIYNTIKMVPSAYAGNSLSIQLTNNVGVQVIDTGDSLTLGNSTDLVTYASPSAAKTFLHKIVGKLICTNQTSANVTIELYEWCARRDNHSTGPGTIMNGVGSATYSKFGVTPFMYQKLCQEFKILKVTRYILAQGESFEHTMNVFVNKIIDSTVIADSGYNALKDITYGILPIQIGLPYNDSTTKTQISLGKNVCDFVFSKWFTTYSYGVSPSTISASTALPSSFTVAEDIMNEDSGTAGALVQA